MSWFIRFSEQTGVSLEDGRLEVNRHGALCRLQTTNGSNQMVYANLVRKQDVGPLASQLRVIFTSYLFGENEMLLLT